MQRWLPLPESQLYAVWHPPVPSLLPVVLPLVSPSTLMDPEVPVSVQSLLMFEPPGHVPWLQAVMTSAPLAYMSVA